MQRVFTEIFHLQVKQEEEKCNNTSEWFSFINCTFDYIFTEIKKLIFAKQTQTIYQ